MFNAPFPKIRSGPHLDTCPLRVLASRYRRREIVSPVEPPMDQHIRKPQQWGSPLIIRQPSPTPARLGPMSLPYSEYDAQDRTMGRLAPVTLRLDKEKLSATWLVKDTDATQATRPLCIDACHVSVTFRVGDRQCIYNTPLGSFVRSDGARLVIGDLIVRMYPPLQS